MKCRARHRRHSRSALAAIAQALEPRLCLSIFTVTNTNDSGSGSLRQAIINAIGTPSADQIVFDTAHVFATPRVISLQSELPLLEGGTLQITGPGSSYLTIRRDAGASNFRIFDSASPFLRLSGLTLSRGNAAEGGAIKLGASTAASLDDVLLSDNHAGTGGAIFVDQGGALTVRNSTISGIIRFVSGGVNIFINAGLNLTEDHTY